MKSKITGGPVEFLFKANILGKYPVAYYRCTETGFIQTEDPYWLNEAYSSAITSLDLGLIERNIRLAEATELIISENFDANKFFVDYAGGYGMFTRMMRDRGYQFFHTDKFCENLFAKHFTIDDLPSATSFEMATAFEVFEHLQNPIEEVAEILKLSDSILFSTELVPLNTLRSANDWWYFAPETGQHIAFYTKKALEVIADKLNLNFYSNNSGLHMLSSKKFDKNIFKEIPNHFARIKIKRVSPALKKLYSTFGITAVEKRPSLLQQDFEHVKKIISA